MSSSSYNISFVWFNYQRIKYYCKDVKPRLNSHILVEIKYKRIFNFCKEPYIKYVNVPTYIQRGLSDLYTRVIVITTRLTTFTHCDVICKLVSSMLFLTEVTLLGDENENELWNLELFFIFLFDVCCYHHPRHRHHHHYHHRIFLWCGVGFSWDY